MSRLKNLFCFHFLAKWALGPFLYHGKNSTGRSDSISFLPSNAWNLLHCYLVIQSLFLLVCNCLCRLLILLVPASGLEMLISFFFAVCATQSFICPTQDFNLVVGFFFFFFLSQKGCFVIYSSSCSLPERSKEYNLLKDHLRTTKHHIEFLQSPFWDIVPQLFQFLIDCHIFCCLVKLSCVSFCKFT